MRDSRDLESRIAWVGMLVLLAGHSLAATGGQQAEGAMPLRLTAFAEDEKRSMATFRPGALQFATVAITIERWSTSEERAVLLAAFDDKGTAGLVAALKESPRVGSIRTPNSSAWDLRYAVQVPTEDGGRRIVVATARPVGEWETRRDSATTDYPFTVVELRLNRHGEGEGKLAPATKIARSEDGSQLQLESHFSEPVHLHDVRTSQR